MEAKNISGLLIIAAVLVALNMISFCRTHRKIEVMDVTEGAYEARSLWQSIIFYLIVMPLIALATYFAFALKGVIGDDGTTGRVLAFLFIVASVVFHMTAWSVTTAGNRASTNA